jgi:hypothetical protein
MVYLGRRRGAFGARAPMAYLRGHVYSPTRSLWLESSAWAVVPENLHRLIELLNFSVAFAVRVTCDHDHVEVRINLLGCFKYLITGSVGQL